MAPRVHEQVTTHACELACPFCIGCEGPGGRDVSPSEAPLPRDPSVVRLVGGDPFARRNLGPWVAWARATGASRVEIEGPGHRLGLRGPLEALLAARPDAVRVRLPALDDHLMRAWTGREDVPGRSLAAIAAVRAAGIEVACVVPVNTLTAPHLVDTIVGAATMLGRDGAGPLEIVLVRAPLVGGPGDWLDLPELARACESIPPGLPARIRLEGYAPCMVPEHAWRAGLFTASQRPRRPAEAPAADCSGCAWRRRCDLAKGAARDELSVPSAPPVRPLDAEAARTLERLSANETSRSVRPTDRHAPELVRWDRSELDLPELLCFAPFTTMSLTELRHRPVPCAQAWVRTEMSTAEEATALGIESAEIERLDAIARVERGVPWFDVANEAWSLREMWNAPLLRHMRAQMVHGGPSDRCRASCRVVLGVEERGVDVLRRPDRELTPEVVDNRGLLLEDIRARRAVLRGTPLELAIGVSAHCNITCGFCSGPGGTYGELSGARLVELIDLLPGMMSLAVSGPGEPLMSSSFGELLAHISARGYPSLSVSLTTNGTLLTRSWIERHRGVRWGQLRMSINAGSASTHERMTGKKLFDQVLNNVAAVARLRDEQERPFRFTLSCVLSELVMGDLSAFAEIVHAHDANIVLEPMTGDDERLSPFTSAERSARLAEECRAVAESFSARNAPIARAFDAMARFCREHAEGPLVQILPRR